MTSKMIFSLLITIASFSCSDDESTDQLLSGTWIEQSPMANRTEVVFESNDLMKITLQNPERNTLLHHLNRVMNISESIDISQLYPGIYKVTIQFNSSRITKKIIVRR